jgi:hypothetical protein
LERPWAKTACLGVGHDADTHEGGFNDSNVSPLDAVRDCRRIGEENCVEFSALGNLCDAHIVADIKARMWIAVRQPPGGSVGAGVQEIDVEVQLTR